MPQLLVRNVEEAVVRRLRERAARDGVSVEEEHRRVLRASLLGKETAKDFKQHLLAIPPAAENEPEIFDRSRDLPRKVQP